MKPLKILFFISFLLFFNQCLFSQNRTFNISSNFLFSSVNKLELVDDSFYHYSLLGNYGFEIKGHFVQNISSDGKFAFTSNLGYRSSAFEGRRYEGEVENSPFPERNYQQYFFSIYNLKDFNANIGGAYNLKRFKFEALFGMSFLLDAKETRQEVHLSGFYDSDIFSPKETYSAKYIFNATSFDLRVSLDYLLFKSVYLNVNYSYGLNSITKQSDVPFLYYRQRILGIGLKFSGLLGKKGNS